MINSFKGLSIVVLAIFFSFINACTPNHESDNTTERLHFVIDSLQKIYAPDKRVSLWIKKISNEQGETSLELWVDKQITYDAVKKSISKNFPGLKTKIELLPDNNNGQIVNGLANNSVINLRSNPRHSAELATQALLGTPLKILKEQGDWYLVQTPNKYIAWADTKEVIRIDKNKLQQYKEAEKIVYNRQYGFSYSDPKRNSQVITDLVLGSILPVIDKKRKYYKVEYPDGRIAWVKKAECISFNELVTKEINLDDLVNTAKEFNGIPYLWGGTSSKAIDCSGFTSTVYFMNGTVLQRDASQQTKYGKEITTKYEYSKLKPGDLLFFGRPASDSLPERVTHVALYMGESMFIHASGKVRINSMDSTNDKFIKSYVPRFVRAVRIKGNFDDFGVQKISDNEFYKMIIK